MKLFNTIFILFIYSHAFCQQQIVYSDKIFIYKVSIDSIPSIDSLNDVCKIKSISVFKKVNNKLIQTIVVPENFIDCSIQNPLEIGDKNFDGINDLKLFKEITTSRNLVHYYWFYSNKTNKFERNKELENLPTPSFNARDKVITTSYDKKDHIISCTYKFINNKLILVEDEDLFSDAKNSAKTHIIRRKLINGKMKTISHTME